MGFSLQFYRFENGEPIDGNRESFYQFLDKKELALAENKLLKDKNGEYLTFDGYFTDLYITQEPELSARLDHATLSDEECQFIYEMSVAAGWIIVNPQGDPMFLIPNNNHQPSDIPEGFEDDVVFIQNSAELQMALNQGFVAFQNFLSNIRKSYNQ